MKNVILRRVFAGVAAFLLFGTFVQAAESQAYVVLVGVSDYKDSAIKSRPHAEADVKALYDLLADKNCFHCSPNHIKLLLGKTDEARKSEPATRENIIKAVRWALSSATADDLVLLCWVGQGGPIGDRTCYFASDSTLKDRAKDAVGAGELEQELDKTKSTRICVLLDVNFKGYDAGKEKISEAGLEKRFFEFDGVKEESDAPPKPIIYLSASNGLTPSIDLEKHGLFMTVALDGLKGAADTEGGEPDGLVTVDELFTFIGKEIPQRAHAATKKEQRVFADLRRSTHFPLTKNPSVSAKVEERLAKLDVLAKDGKLNEEIAKEGRAYLSRMPRLEAQRQLRKKYQQLADGQLGLDEFLKQRQASLESLKMSPDDAQKFAERVLKVARIARDGYVKPVKLQELTVAAVKGLYRRLEEKLPPELNEKLEKAKDLAEGDLDELLADARQRLGNREDLKGQKAVDLALDSMLHSLDNYSTFIDSESAADFDRMTRQVFIGVGIQIQKDLSRDMIKVMTPLRGSPAHKIGVKAGDIITKVTNIVDKQGNALPKPVETSMKGLTTEDAVKIILGKKGTKVKLTIDREGAEEPMDFDITRGSVEVETVIGVRRNADDSWDYYIDRPNRIVYVRLTQFAYNTERDLKAVMRDLMKQGINAMILDLRFNPGGYLDSAVDISDLFVEDGVIVSIRHRAGKPHDFSGHKEGSLLDFPLVVLVNGHSASASEIVSACIQDHNRGIVMGERSFGKGSVQNILKMNLGEGDSEVKLTTASFWRPSGKNLNKFPTSKESDDWGVQPHPDYAIKLNPTERYELMEHLRRNEIIPRRDGPKKDPPGAFTDRQLEKAVDYLRNQATVKAASRKAG